MAEFQTAPYQPRLTLETLLARAGRAPQPHTIPPRSRVPVQGWPAERTDRAPQLELPKAIVLVTTVATCSCGATYRLPNRHVLLRYDAAGHSNSLQYRREDAERFGPLPRERKEVLIDVPFCEQCF